MKVGDSVRKAIDDWGMAELQPAMLHACNAVDGTASKRYPSDGSNNSRFTRLLRENYSIFGPMAVPGVDLVATRWPVNVAKPKAPGGGADIADVIYGIHRCTHGHGDELPDGFDLVLGAPEAQDLSSVMMIERGNDGPGKCKVRLSDRVIFGLIAVAVMSPENVNQTIPEGYHLRFAGEVFPINDWWGRAAEFASILARNPLPSIEFDFTNWLVVSCGSHGGSR